MIEIGFLFGCAIYGIIWFLTLFMVLPFGVVSQHEDGRVVPGSEAGAPARPMIYRKLAITTLLSAVFYARPWAGQSLNLSGPKKAEPKRFRFVSPVKNGGLLPKPENSKFSVHGKNTRKKPQPCH